MRLILAALAIATLSSCATTPPPAPEPQHVTTAPTPIDVATLADSEWLAEDIDNRGVIDRLQSRLQFVGTTRVTGLAGCNVFNGTATMASDKVAFSPLATTRKLCAPAVMDQEARFLDALGRVRSATSLNGLLYLHDSSGNAILRFSRLARSAS